MDSIQRNEFIVARDQINRPPDGTVDREKTTEPSDSVDLNFNSDAEPSFMDKTKTFLQKINPFTTPPKPEKELTVLFYMNGMYMDIGQEVAESVLHLEKAGSDANVNLVAQLGRAPYFGDPKEEEVVHIPVDKDWSGVRRYEIRQANHDDMHVAPQEFMKLETELPGNPLLPCTIGKCFLDSGDRVKAKEYFDKALSLGIEAYAADPDSDQSRKLLRDYNEATKHIDKSRKHSKIFESERVGKLGSEVSMSDPSTLKDFVSWGMEKYPAKHYVIVTMAHGKAWEGASEMKPQAMASAIKDGAEAANLKTGRNDKIDALVFNSCLMGNVEALAELKDAAAVTVASENVAYTGCFDEWDALMGAVQKDLQQGGTFDPKKFAGDIVEHFRSRGADINENFPRLELLNRTYSTLAAVDNSKIGALVDSWKGFVQACSDNGVTDKQIFTAINNAKSYGNRRSDTGGVFGFNEHLRDMGNIMQNIVETPDIPAPVKEAADGVRKALSETLIDEMHTGKGMEGSTGLSVWAPNNAADIWHTRYNYEENSGNFARETGWSNRLWEGIKPHAEQVSRMADLEEENRKMRRKAFELNDGSMSSIQEKAEIRTKINENQRKITELRDGLYLDKQ